MITVFHEILSTQNGVFQLNIFKKFIIYFYLRANQYITVTPFIIETLETWSLITVILGVFLPQHLLFTNFKDRTARSQLLRKTNS